MILPYWAKPAYEVPSTTISTLELSDSTIKKSSLPSTILKKGAGKNTFPRPFKKVMIKVNQLRDQQPRQRIMPR